MVERLKPQAPDLAEFSGHDTSQVLSEQQASKYRSVIGIALYVSADRPDIAHSARKLSSVMSRPTALAWRAAVRLTQYMLATSSYALHLEPGEPGTSMLHGCVSAGSDLIECYADADCCGSKADRKSIGSAMQWFTLPLGPNDRCPSRRWRVNGMPVYPDAAMHYSFVKSGNLSQANLQ